MQYAWLAGWKVDEEWRVLAIRIGIKFPVMRKSQNAIAKSVHVFEKVKLGLMIPTI